MKKYTLLLIAICMVSLVTQVVRGAENTFETRLSVVTDDYTAPSVPGNLLALALSSTQINLTWNASVDDVAVIGYRIFRDGMIIGTTTSIFYQDSGLTASTSYDYTVESFDSVPRYSGQSATSTAVTLETPVIPPDPEPTPETGSGPRSGSRPTSPPVNPDLSQLANVSNLQAVPSEKSIALTWNNPASNNFDGVRIVKSDKFFPRDIYDGEVAYEGRGESFTDRNVVIGKTYYYTVFSRGVSVSGVRQYSSGVLTFGALLTASGVPSQTDPLGSIPFVTNVDPQIAGLTLFDFHFIQNSKELAVVGEGVVVDGSKNLTISLSYEKVPEILKTIVVTFVNAKDPSKRFTFLLRVNKDKTAYDAVIAPLKEDGKYEVTVTILDYKNQGLKKITGNMRVVGGSGVENYYMEIPRVTLSDFSRYLIVLISVFLVILFLVRRKSSVDEI